MKLKTPIKTIHKNLMLTKSGEIWAYYRIKPEVIPSSNYDKMEEQKVRFKLLFEELEKYKDIHLEMFPQQMNLEKRFEYIEKDFHPETAEIGRYYNKETIDLLEQELGAVTQHDFILGVRLKGNLLEGSEDMKEIVKNAFVSVTDNIVNWLGLEREMGGEFFDRFKAIEDELYQHVSVVDGTRLKEDDLIYVNRYNFLRSIHHSVEEEKQKRGISNITDAIIDPTEPGFLKLQTTEGECYMSFVVVDNFPVDMEYSHLFYRAQSMPFPIEVHVKAQYQDKESTIRKVDMTKQRFKETDNDRYRAGEDVDDTEATYSYMLNRLRSNLKNNRAVFMNWVASFVVYGQTKEECKTNANTVMRVMKESDIHCVRPIADQLQLFYKFLHGQPLQFERNWVQRTSHVAFAENMFGVSNRLGSNIGFYFGRVAKGSAAVPLEQSIASSRDIVLFHPFIANEGIKGAETDSPHISITGQTGKGKSFLVKLITLYLSFLDAKVLMTDPKNEIQYWFDKVLEDPQMRVNYPMFAELLRKFHYVTLDPHDERNWGVLDPICFLEGPDARDTAQSIIEQIYDLQGKDDVKTEILQALTDVIESRARGEQVGLMHVVYKLMESESINIRNAGNLLYQMTHNSVLQLIFSEGQSEGLALNSKINVLQIEGLDLPKEDDDPRYYSDGERKSLCLMIPLAKFCEKFGSRDKQENTAIIFDEAWMLTKARGGKKLVKSMRRVGRSYKNQLYLVTQSVSDVQSDDDRGNFGARFAFDESEERDDILQYMGLSKTDENRELVKNMTKGQCLFRDFYGRVGKLAIDCLFNEWTEAFKTVEKSHSARAEEEIMS